MNIFQKQSINKPTITILVILLLTFGICISSLGFTAWVGTKAQFSKLDGSYTTLAVLTAANKSSFHDLKGYKTAGADSYWTPDGSLYVGPIDAEAAAKRSEYYMETDKRILLSAHVEGLLSLSSGRFDHLGYVRYLDDYCYSGCVAALACTAISTDEWGSSTVTLRVVDWVSRSSAYDLPPEEDSVQIYTRLANQDGSPIFTVGKTYLVRGFYEDYWIEGASYGMRRRVTSETGEAGISRKIHIDQLNIDDRSLFPQYNFAQITDLETGAWYLYVQNGLWPAVTEYTGDWADFLETEEGRVWKEEIIPCTEISQDSAPVILTNKLESMYNFALGAASILEGRMFTQEEYDQGQRVCVISAAYAAVNGLKLGDTINLDFYDSGYFTYNNGTTEDVQRLPLRESRRINVKQDYTIVGLYTCPGLGGSHHDFGQDTIFVPKESVAGWESCVQGSPLPVLSSVIIRNGSIDEFQAHMAAEGKEGAYFYIDQGYSELEASLRTMLKNTQWMLFVGLGVFLLVVMVILHLETKRRGAVSRSLRLLGVKPAKIWCQSAEAILTMALVAIFLGNLLNVAFFQLITTRLISSELTLKLDQILLCAGAQFVVLCVLIAISMAIMASRKPMHRK